MKWFHLFIGIAFVPSAQVTAAFALIKEHYTHNCRGCKEFNLYFFDTWLTDSYPVSIWNQFRAEVPRTNNDCEGYNSRLAKRALNFISMCTNSYSYSVMSSLTRKPTSYRSKEVNNEQNVAAGMITLTLNSISMV